MAMEDILVQSGNIKQQMIMKKILFSIFTLALATMVGCQKSDIDDTQNNPTNSESKITVTANIVSDGQTRVALTPETDGEGKPVVKIDWKNGGEAFNVYGIDEDPIKVYGPETFAQSKGSLFSGNNPYQHSLYYYATYPASNLITVQKVADEVSIIFNKSNFTSQNGKLSEERTLMWASVSNLDENTKFNFEHLTSLLMPKFRIVGKSVNLSADKIASITFKDMLVPEGTADFNIDCTSHTSEDDIYVYIPKANSNYNTIEVIVTTNDENVFDGEISIGGTAIVPGKLYTANIWLTPVVPNNVITYTTSNDKILPLDNNWGVGDDCVYTSHTFADGVGVGQIVLKDGITSIPGYGFYNLDYLQSIKLPSAITTIGDFAFSSASGLLSIDLRHITTIGQYAFHVCSQLSQITMPNNNYTIGELSFAKCAITEIDLSKASSINNYAFQDCKKLTTVIIKNPTPPSFGSYNPFTNCSSLESIYVPDDKINNYKAIVALSEVKDKIKGISQMP